MTLTHEDMARLKAPFANNEHEMRQGYTNKGKTQMRWFVYVRREAIINRLDELFPGEWECKTSNQQTHQNYATATCVITVRSLSRDGTGTGTGNNNGNNEKGAATDAFKRAASMWGIGLYLQRTPMIWTEYSEQDKWNQARETEAGNKFQQWLETMAGKPPLKPQRQTSPQTSNVPEQPAGPEPEERDVILVTVSTLTKNGTVKPYYGFRTADGTPVTAFSRALFVAGNYMSRGDWIDADKLILDPPIQARIKTNNGFWNVLSVKPYLPDDPSWQKLLKEIGATTNDGDIPL